MRSLGERLDEAEKRITEPSFRTNTGLGNEVGYYIFDYPRESELQVREWVEYMERKNSNSDDEYNLLVFDLYDIMIELLKERNYLDKCFELEKKKGFQKVSTAVSNLMRINSTEGLIVEYIKERIHDKAIVFITGVGKCYPIFRSHTVLNNLHQVIDTVPVVMFYPGVYSGQELLLFGEIKDDNYYRAFKLVD